MEKVKALPVIDPLFLEGGDVAPDNPKKFSLLEIDTRTAQRLNFLWHSMLPETHLGNLVGCKHPASFACVFENRFYAVSIWTDPIAANRLSDGAFCMELRRMAICDSAPKNTASWMLSRMAKIIKKKYPDIIKLVSYQAVSNHIGTIYKASNWTAAAESKPMVWHKNENRRSMQVVSNKIRREYKL